jgi:pilus assembly protein CpaB
MQRLEVVIAIVSLIISLIIGFCVYKLVYTAPKIPVQTLTCPKPIEMKDVMIANRLIETGDPISEAITYEKWPESVSRADFYVKDKVPAEALKSLIARRVINPGEPITQNSVVDRKTHGILSALLGEGMRAVSISLEQNAGMAGLLSPGDVVDVLVALNATGKDKEETNQTIVCGVRVLAIDQHLSVAGGDPLSKKLADATPAQNPKSVTLEVTPQQAASLASSAKLGTLSLSLHSTNDNQTVCVEAAPKPAKQEIRIIRGDNSQIQEVQ